MAVPETRLHTDMARARLASALVAYTFGAQEAAQAGGSARRASFSRQTAMYLLHVGFGMSLSRVATAFGRDRSTAAYACHRIEDAREDEEFDTLMEGLEEAIRNAPPPDAAREIPQ